ncbi:leucine zipper domain-containing protein [Cryobacterium sp. GrIS_2_6]|uniref:leucine zipper domain-containing protein n=1 Tax=Cryobacterium sp. GrIS_2_6 TaxID=3162785 RepID=UPI002DFE50F5|nr:hypothetical protein [Cryobacterium psychrotolerans]
MIDGQDRWRILRLHVEDQVPLAALARDAGISERTLQRCHFLYRRRGIDGLDAHPRADKGVRRSAPEAVAFIERLALTRPSPSLATLNRLTAGEAQQQGYPTPSYSTVRQIVLALDPPLVTLALEGPTSYRDRHKLVLRRRAERPNETGSYFGPF